MTFPRTPNAPLVSVLLPTRGRPEHLTNTIASLYNNATDKGAFEILLWIDADDHPTVAQALHLIEAGVPLRFIVGQRVGYARAHEMVNELCQIARGDWLWLFNDDALCLTAGWDDQIANASPPPEFRGSPDVAMIGVNTPGFSPWVFPALRRETFTILGHYSRHCCNDTYLEKVMRPLAAYFTVGGITIRHFQGEIVDETRQGSLVLPPSDWDSGWIPEAIEADRAKLRAHMEGMA